MRAGTAVVLALVTLGCDGSDTLEVGWENRFADEARAATAVRFEHRVLEGGCDGTELWSTSFDRVTGPTESPPALERGTYGFAAVAYGEDCSYRIEGCEVVEFVGILELDAIVVTLEREEMCCGGDVASGVCRCESTEVDCCSTEDNNCDGQADDQECLATRSDMNLRDDDCDTEVDECDEDPGTTGDESGFCFDAEDNDCDGAANCDDSDCAAECMCFGEFCGNCQRCDSAAMACSDALANGEACAGGVCGGGECCVGCLSGSTCLDMGPEQSEAACGAAGDACRSCCSGYLCASGACVRDITTPEVTYISAGDDFTCAQVGADIKCWGRNENWQLSRSGSGTITVSSALDLREGDFGTGARHVCAPAHPGSGMWCWGDSRRQQVGSFSNMLTPQDRFSAQSFEAASAGDSHSCGLNPVGNDQVDCWGDRRYGQLGNGVTNANPDDRQQVEHSNGSTFRPRLGTSSTVRHLDAGKYHTCAAEKDELDVHCWGRNQSGQVNPSSTASEFNTATRVLGVRADWIDAAATHSCAIYRADLRCWGEDFSGIELLSQPGTGWVTVSGGERVLCATTESRQLFCRGLPTNAVISNLSGSPDPDGWIQVPGSYTAVAVGRAHACALDANTVLWCWGDNSFNQLGDSDPSGELRTVCL